MGVIISTPGAEMLGFVNGSSPKQLGPRLAKLAIIRDESCAVDAKTSW
jgi:hypothetical protein